MNTPISRREALAALGCLGFASLTGGTTVARGYERENYTSPYRLKYTIDREQLIGDILHGERGDPHREASIEHAHWYTHHTRHRDGAWGPGARRYEPLPGLAQRPVEWKRERVIANAARFIGYDYQHHHIPDWDPPAGWPWKHCCAGHNGKGVDCSNFTSFVYNQAFGIHMSSGIGEQSREHLAIERGGYEVKIRTIELPESYQERKQVLKTGDLLYVRHAKDMAVSHVVLWVGSIGHSPSGVPLVLDSHGDNVVDAERQHIPCGIHLRPYHKDSWYNKNAAHAHRIFNA